MSYKSLLFCPDEKAAKLVAQVLGELEFTVTLANDPQQTAQRLADEHFDAVVVDIANEQDAALLFKSARDSQVNHSALSVAVVEGQAGVAKAFRIGANLVLTKPINVEQSKGTLRVARGLLRKNESRTTAAPAKPAAVSPASPAPVAPAPPPSAPMFSTPAIPASLLAQPAPTTVDTPFSSLEVEEEVAPAPEAAEAALLESMPDPTGAKPATAEQTWTPKLKGSAEPIAASTGSSAGAATAPALEKPAIEIKAAAPLASHEPVTADFGAKESFEAAAVPVPNFSYHHDSGSSKKFIKTAVMLVLFGVAGYMGWQRFQLGQYLTNLRTSSSTSADQEQPAADSSANMPAPKPAPKQTPDNDSGLVFPETTTAADDSAAPSSKSATASPAPESIQVDDLTSKPEPKITVTAKPQPLVVRSGSKIVVTPKAQPAPPTLSVAAAAPSDALAGVVNSSAPLPTLKILRVSQGVSQGLLIKKVPPIYPPAALQLHKQGAVELLANVNKDGSISTVRVLSGDVTLAKAASDAVKQWKYRPYLLNGEPVEIETQITVNFNAPH